MADERIYTIPLRKETLKVPQHRRARKAIRSTRQFLIRHTKNPDIVLGHYLNEAIHARGRSNPPNKIQVKVYKEGEKLMAELATAPIELKEKIEKEEAKGKPIVPAKPEEIKAEGKQAEKLKEKEETIEKLEHEKEEVLKHPPEKKEGRKVISPEPGGERAAQMEKVERTKAIFPKKAKPYHEKKK